MIRNKSILSNQKKKILDIEKKEKLIKDLEKKIKIEQQKKNELDDELNKLTNMENEIMSRIIFNNEMQRKLIEDFEKSYNVSGGTPRLLMSLNNNNISCINKNEQFDDDYDYEEINNF